MKKLTSKTDKIRQYLEKNPGAKPKQVADALGMKSNYVGLVMSLDRKKARKEEAASVRLVPKKTGAKPSVLGKVVSEIHSAMDMEKKVGHRATYDIVVDSQALQAVSVGVDYGVVTEQSVAAAKALISVVGSTDRARQLLALIDIVC